MTSELVPQKLTEYEQQLSDLVEQIKHHYKYLAKDLGYDIFWHYCCIPSYFKPRNFYTILVYADEHWSESYLRVALMSDDFHINIPYSNEHFLLVSTEKSIKGDQTLQDYIIENFIHQTIVYLEDGK